MMFGEGLYKNEVARSLKVSARTLRYWLNDRYFIELSKLGYKKTDKILTPKQLNYLHDKIDLTPLNFN